MVACILSMIDTAQFLLCGCLFLMNVMHQVRLIDSGNRKDAWRTLHSGRKIKALLSLSHKRAARRSCLVMHGSNDLIESAEMN